MNESYSTFLFLFIVFSHFWHYRRFLRQGRWVSTRLRFPSIRIVFFSYFFGRVRLFFSGLCPPFPLLVQKSSTGLNKVLLLDSG